MILSIDLGTTNWKAALFDIDGSIAGIAHIPTPIIYEGNSPCYDAACVKSNICGLLTRLQSDDILQSVQLIVFTGMAEAGLPVERTTLKPLSNIWPWFDRRALPIYEETRHDKRFAGRPAITGLPDSFKYGIYKLLTLLRGGAYNRKRIIWMGLVAYAASLLTGECAEDISIAARTDCIDIIKRDWDDTFISSIGLGRENFPRLISPGAPVGILKESLCGIPAGTTVCIGGHDHICAACATDVFSKGELFLSAGTAQVALFTADKIETDSGLSYGPAPSDAPYTVLGSIQSAGGSINFWKNKLYPKEDFDVLISEAAEARYPSGLLYLPYLAGSGAPHINPSACGTLTGLRDDTSRGAIIAGVYEGIAMETRYLTESMNTGSCTRITCMGGLTRHTRYMQTLADVLGMTICVPVIDEGTLYGAARLASNHINGRDLPALDTAAIYTPDHTVHDMWNKIYVKRYMPFMNIIRAEDF